MSISMDELLKKTNMSLVEIIKEQKGKSRRKIIIIMPQAEIAALKKCQGQEVDSSESGVTDTEALKEVINFDEVFTSKRVIYSRAEDKMLGCGLSPKGEMVEYVLTTIQHHAKCNTTH
ncbi:uncharacterized protein LOC119635845 isoform X2 [Glossina fuscipes]|uniref:Uncharacterized protein LOC119635845 isoform X2 n=1 Tax=Glossina fuscipes TaxID=7396 RepID=A0A9C5YWF0_9MUSC|nr:uncharacterized protein LOC119635845 isoform X2 [Glossina fuscipes]